MAFTGNDQKKGKAFLETKGFWETSDGSMTNGKIKAKSSESGGSIYLGPTKYTELPDLKKSTKL